MGAGHKTAYTQNERPVETIILLEGINQHKFGTPLTAIEKAWLMDEISAFIDRDRNASR